MCVELPIKDSLPFEILLLFQIHQVGDINKTNLNMNSKDMDFTGV